MFHNVLDVGYGPERIQWDLQKGVDGVFLFHLVNCKDVVNCNDVCRPVGGFFVCVMGG